MENVKVEFEALHRNGYVIDGMKGLREIFFDSGGLIRLKKKLKIMNVFHLKISAQTVPSKVIVPADRNKRQSI